MSKETYIKSMVSWAKKAEQSTGLDYAFIVAQWGWETGWGTNRGSKTLNNHAGIKYSKYAPAGTTKDGMYAKYPTMDLFIKDYTRVMNLSYYTGIKSARTDRDKVIALNVSPWSESDYDINTMLSAMSIARGTGEGIKIINNTTTATTMPTTINIPNVKSLDNKQLENYATIGLAAAVLLALMPSK